MKKNISLICVLLCLVSFSSAYGPFRPVEDEVTFDTNVDGCYVYVNGLLVANPMEGRHITLKIKRDRSNALVSFRKEGYKDQTLALTRSFSFSELVKSYWDVGSYGSSTDSSTTRGLQEYSPNQYFVQMETT